ncbi:hypothetical protein NPIL_416891 [Nephila pilipes]|uniref:Uncharacterized protein n=1 Tax=Nephila pilipes TaxID=299642 RepID=A0A8X6R3B1_NEPPI|nr:hypothetical protein NPIL_416891 [Nephila pilipes]
MNQIENRNLITYGLKTVMYGTSCAPILTFQTIKYSANLKEASKYPLASKVLLRDVYVDWANEMARVFRPDQPPNLPSHRTRTEQNNIISNAIFFIKLAGRQKMNQY